MSTIRAVPDALRGICVVRHSVERAGGSAVTAVREVPLGPSRLNAVALVDEGDYNFVSQWRWTVGDSGYAVRWEQADNRRRVVFMHRELCVGNPTVDHINRDKLDNRRANLRPATHAQQNANMPKRRTPTSSRYKGVTLDRRPLRKRWVALIRANHRQYWLGRFTTETEAAAAYAAAAKLLFGEYADPAERAA